MQKILQFASEHRQPTSRISYLALILPIFLLTSMFSRCLSWSVDDQPDISHLSNLRIVIPLLSPIFLQLPNADVVQFHLVRPASTMEVGYYSEIIFERYHDFQSLTASNKVSV